MSALSLQIVQPANGTGFAPGSPVTFQGNLTGDATGLFFKWYSSLNSAGTQDHPELNTADHSAAILSWSAALAEFGSHVVVLAATDQDGNDLPSIKKVTRSAMAGGAPPAATQPCIVHRPVAQIRTPSADGQTLSKASPTIEVLAPIPWAKENPPGSGTWVANTDYQGVNGTNNLGVNGITYKFNLAPDGPLDPAHSADVPISVTTLRALPFFRADDNTWFRWTNALPANLGTGNYVLTLTVTGGGVSTQVSRKVVLS